MVKKKLMELSKMTGRVPACHVRMLSTQMIGINQLTQVYLENSH